MSNLFRSLSVLLFFHAWCCSSGRPQVKSTPTDDYLGDRFFRVRSRAIGNGTVPSFGLVPLVSMCGDTMYFLGPHANQQVALFEDVNSPGRLIQQPVHSAGCCDDEERVASALEYQPYLIATGYDKPIMLFRGMQKEASITIYRTAYFAEAGHDTTGELHLRFKHYLRISNGPSIPLPENIGEFGDHSIAYADPWYMDPKRVAFPIFKRNSYGAEEYSIAFFHIESDSAATLDSTHVLPHAIDTVPFRSRNEYLCGLTYPVLLKDDDLRPIDLSDALFNMGANSNYTSRPGRFVHLDHAVRGDTCRIAYAILSDTISAYYAEIILREHRLIHHLPLPPDIDFKTVVLGERNDLYALCASRDSLVQWRTMRERR